MSLSHAEYEANLLISLGINNVLFNGAPAETDHPVHHDVETS